VGVVRDVCGAAIEGAAIEAQAATARTDSLGAFRLWTAAPDTLTISVRRIGFATVSALLTARNRQWDTVQVEMEPNTPRLSAVRVNESAARRALGLRDFEERRAEGLGVFITRSEIVARNSSRLSDVLRNKRGVRIVRLRNGTYGARSVSHGDVASAACAPEIWLDGQRARGLEIDDVLADDVEAVELYESTGSIPFQFTPQSSTTRPCGTIVIWTRIPGG